MATVYLSPIGNGAQFFDDNGAPLNGGFINTYAAGTTTPQATYTSPAGTTQNANPIALNSAGRIATQVWLSAATAYKFIAVNSVSSAVGATQDNLYSINDPTTNNAIGYTGATISGALIMNLAAINEAQGANIAVASQINLTTATGNYLSLTGSGTVTAIQLSQGAYREFVVNSSSCAFVNSATMALLGSASFTPAVGDIIGFRGEAAPIVRNVLYQKATGIALSISSVPISATQAQQETSTVTSAWVSPGVQQFHPSAAKAWVQYDNTGGLTSSYNLTSVTDNGAGNLSPVWNVDFSSANYVITHGLNYTNAATAATTFVGNIQSQIASGCNFVTTQLSGFANVDVTYVELAAQGDQ